MIDFDRDDWPVHRPECLDAPIPGRAWYHCRDPDRPRVNPDGVCEGCGYRACVVCGRDDCPEHAACAPLDTKVVLSV